MPDFGAPVAQQINASPAQGFSTLSSMLGLQQQQQAIQSGALGIQRQQAELPAVQAQSQVTQAKMAQVQRFSQMVQSGTDDQGNSLRGANGELDPALMTMAAGRVAPLAPEIAQGILKTMADKVGLQAAAQSLDSAGRQRLQGVLQGLTVDPSDAGIQSAREAMLGWVGQHPEMTPAANYASGLINQIANTQDPKVRAHLATKLPAFLQPGEAVGTQSTAGTVDTGQTIQPVVAAPAAAGGGAVPAGPGIQKTIPPQIITPPGGVPVPYSGKGPVPNAYGPGPQPTTQDVENFGAYNQNLNSRVAVASDLLPRVTQAEDALNRIRAGGGAQNYAALGKMLQAANAPQGLVDAVAGGNLAAAQEAEKYLFQTTFAGLKQSMQGDPSRVAEFNSAEQIFPSLGTDPRATKAVLKFMSDQGSRDFAEQQALNKARTDGTFNPVTWQAQWQNRLRAGSAPGVPASQVPGAPVQKAMPTGDRLKAYADRYTGGDTGKAQAALKAHGYQ